MSVLRTITWIFWSNIYRIMIPGHSRQLSDSFHHLLQVRTKPLAEVLSLRGPLRGYVCQSEKRPPSHAEPGVYVCPEGSVGADSPTVLLADPWLRTNCGRTLSRVFSNFCSRASRRRSTCSFSLLSISSRRRSIVESSSLQTWATRRPHHVSEN